MNTFTNITPDLSETQIPDPDQAFSIKKEPDLEQAKQLLAADIRLIAELHVATGEPFSVLDEQIKAALYTASLSRYKNNQSNAARVLDVNRGTFRKWGTFNSESNAHDEPTR